MTNPRSPEHVVKAGYQSQDDPLTFVMSSETKDRVGDIIRQDGWSLKSFQKNPIALFGHDHAFPIGTWDNVNVRDGKLLGTLKLADKGTSDRVDEIRALIDQRVLKAVSVGFSIQKYEPLDKNDPWGGWDIQKANLHETSVVSVPANPEAVALAKSIGTGDETMELVFGRMSADLTRRAVSGEKRHIEDLVGTETSDAVRRRLYLERNGML